MSETYGSAADALEFHSLFNSAATISSLHLFRSRVSTGLVPHNIRTRHMTGLVPIDWAADILTETNISSNEKNTCLNMYERKILISRIISCSPVAYLWNAILVFRRKAQASIQTADIYSYPEPTNLSSKCRVNKQRFPFHPYRLMRSLIPKS